MGEILRIVLILIAVFMLAKAVVSLAKRKMTDQFCLFWAFLAVLIGLAGILLKPSTIGRYISVRGLILVMIALIAVLWGMWFISTQVSILMRKNQEIAMQTSLLNQDCVQLLKKIESLEEELEQYKKDEGTEYEKSTVCD